MNWLFFTSLPNVSVGIDAQCEYVFKDMEPQVYPPQLDYNAELLRKPAKKQTTITDTFRERKRKNTDSDITQCKEKKKRESTLFEKFKNLKESYGRTSKVLKHDLDKSTVMSDKRLQELTYLKKPDVSRAVPSENAITEKNDEHVKSTCSEEQTTYEINDDDFIDDEFMDENKINDILTEIESEISKGSSKSEVGDKIKFSVATDKCSIQKSVLPKSVNIRSIPSRNSYIEIENYKAMNMNRKRVNKTFSKKTNYNFIELLEKNVDLSDTEQTTEQEKNSFSDTIRSHIEKYLQKAKTNVEPADRILDLIQDEPILSKESGPIVTAQDSNIIGKDDDIDESMQLSPNSKKITITDGYKRLTVNDESKQVSVLENKVRSIDLTINELPSVEYHIQEIDEENELPSVELHLKTNKDEIAIEYVAEKIDSKLIPEDIYAENNTSSNINLKQSLEPEPVPVIKESIYAVNISVNKLNKESDLKGPESILNAGTLDFLDGPIENDIDDNTSVETNAVLEEKQEFAIIEPPRRVEPKQIDIKSIEKENIELVAYNNPTHKTAFQQHDTELPIALPSTSCIAETNEKQEIRVMELWKSYIKELPLESEKNMEVTKSILAFNIDNQMASTQQNDKSKELSVALQNCMPKDAESKEKYKLREINKNKAIGFNPPFKRPTCDSNWKPKSNNSLQIATTSEKQSLLEIEPPNSIFEENREITTMSFPTCGFSSQPICIQRNILHKLPYILPITTSPVPELQDKQELLVLEQPKNCTTGNKDITAYKNYTSNAIKNHPTCTQLNYDNYNVLFDLPSTVSLTPESRDKPRPLEIVSTKMYNKEVVTINNPTTSVIKNPQAFTQDYGYTCGSSYTRADNQNHYINKYSFSSNKTDVSTQETTDHVVRVIRNLRIDLDITEIVSETKKTMDTAKDIEYDNEEDSNMAFKRPKIEITPTIEQCNENSNALESFSSDYCKQVEEYNPKALSNSFILTAVEETSENQIIPLPSTELKQLRCDIKHEKDKYCEEVDKDGEGDQNTKKHQFSKYKSDDSTLERKPNNLMGILQKYSNIMR